MLFEESVKCVPNYQWLVVHKCAGNYEKEQNSLTPNVKSFMLVQY